MRQVRWMVVPLVALGLALARPAQAQPRATLTVNPFGLLLGTVGLELEYAPTDGYSVYLGPWAWMYEGPLIDHLTDGEELDYAAGAVGGVRFFLAGDAPEGLWIGPEGTLGVAQGDVEGASNSSFDRDGPRLPVTARSSLPKRIRTTAR